jgi:hypothetical protein
MQLTSFLPGDAWVLLAMHLVLGAFVVLGVGASLRARFRARRGGIKAEVQRGPQSMGVFTAMFATALGVFYAALDLANVLLGYKSFLVVVDFIAIGYLFLDNNWFRNHVLGAASEVATERD